MNDGLRMLVWATFLWLWEHWRALLIGIALVVIVLLLTGCYVGVVNPATSTPTVTPWSTNTPTPEPTPTPETLCVPGSYVTVLDDTPLYDQPDMQHIAMVSYTSADGVFHFEQAILLAGESALLLFDRIDSAWRAIAAEGTSRLGWLAVDALPVECR
jgi:hypothetical protein